MKCMYSSVRAGCVGGEFVSLEATWEGLKILIIYVAIRGFENVISGVSFVFLCVCNSLT